LILLKSKIGPKLLISLSQKSQLSAIRVALEIPPEPDEKILL
jgi:hypothetical protein